jgi:hypothetical protein
VVSFCLRPKDLPPCAGEISFVRRIWADGKELDLTTLTLRVHRGGETQEPDPLIVAKEGAGYAPAYRGLAYVVFERLPLEAYGNRVPQFTFEVVRALPGLREQVRAVNLIPGSTEFGYQPTRVTRNLGLGNGGQENRNQLQTESDVVASLDQLQALCPALAGINIIVSWFGDDLRAGSCTVAPRVDNAVKATVGATWGVAGLSRGTARLVGLIDGAPSYGGTPSDASVLALIAECKRRGLKVTLYPFIMMDVPPGNVLPNPQGGASQPPLPWRGRVTCHPAAGQAGSPDGSAAASAQISAFVGTAAPADFSTAGGAVTCAKPNEWSFRRHILHHAALAQIAGGVDTFIIGSEMIGLTRVRSSSGVYPFVTALVSMAADVRTMLGPQTRITYAADWTEYGAHVLAGGQEVRFPLDPLWASPNISAVGVDWYPPVSDWRHAPGHLDASLHRSPHDLAYLAARQRSGEAFDWFYASDAARDVQARSMITDGAFGKPWTFRQKDLAGWWGNAHRERVAGAELASPTAWTPGSKPVMLLEIGCPAVDLGANAPNVFPDLRSAEGGRPFFSVGQRDDLMQSRALSAQIGVLDPASPLFSAAANPLRAGGGRMIAPDDVAVWAWDARPFPAFPMLGDVWSDAPNWSGGHWLNGRLENAPLDALLAQILADYGLPPAALTIDQSADGYVIDRPMSAREALEPLIRLFALDARMSAGALVVRERADGPGSVIAAGEIVPREDGQPFLLTRAQETELPHELRVAHIDGDFEYAAAAARSRRLSGASRRQTTLDAPVVMRAAQAEALAEERLTDVWGGRETLQLTLPPRALAFEPGDLIAVTVSGQPRRFRITGIRDGAVRAVTAVSFAPPQRVVRAEGVSARRAAGPSLAVQPFAVVLELAAARGPEPVLTRIAAHASPWPGDLSVFRVEDGGFALAATVPAPERARLERAQGAPHHSGRGNRRASVEIELASGALADVSDEAALGGANSFALQGPDGSWEIVAAAHIELTGPRRYRLSRLLRGLGGSEPQAARTLAAGALVVLLDDAVIPLESGLDRIGAPADYRVVPPGGDPADALTLPLASTPQGLALRPLAPVHLKARRSPQGVALFWIRRARHGGDGWGAAEVPIAESAERYEVTVHAGATVKRRFEVTAQGALYAAADELADFGGPQSTLDLSVAQISPEAGIGAAMRRLLTM